MKLTQVIQLFILTLLISSCGTKPLEEGKYRINGLVTGLGNGEIYLRNYPNPIDTIKVTDGKFVFENTLENSVGDISILKDAANRGSDKETYLNLFVEPKIMSLHLDYNDFSLSKMKGSNTQDDKYRLNALTGAVSKKYKKELEAFDVVREKYSKARKAKASEEELMKIKYEDDTCRDNLEPMWKKQGDITLQFIKDNPTSFVSAQSLLFQLSDLKYAEAKAIFDQLNPAHLKIGIGTRLAKEVENMKKGIPGVLAANFNTLDINGKPIKLSDFKGKYLLIDFWASWCVPCRKGNPHLIKLYKKYHSKGFEILGVSDDDRNHDAWRKAVKKDEIGIWNHVLRGLEYKEGTYEQINIDKDISEGYNISTLPTKILIGPDGIILGRYGSGGGNDEDMDNDLAKLFNK